MTTKTKVSARTEVSTSEELMQLVKSIATAQSLPLEKRMNLIVDVSTGFGTDLTEEDEPVITFVPTPVKKVVKKIKPAAKKVEATDKEIKAEYLKQIKAGKKPTQVTMAKAFKLSVKQYDYLTHRNNHRRINMRELKELLNNKN